MCCLLCTRRLWQVLIACLRIDDRGGANDDRAGEHDYTHESSTHAGRSTDHSAAAASAPASAAAMSQLNPAPLPPNTALVEFMGDADLKAEELVVLTGASASRESWGTRDGGERRQGRSVESGRGGGGDADILEVRGGAWEHIGLPRHRLVDVLLWAQRHVSRADGGAAGPTSSGSCAERGWEADDRRGEPGGSLESKRRSEEEAAAERMVARVAMGVLQGLLVGELPRGFVASVVSSSDGREPSQGGGSSTNTARGTAAPVVSPPNDVALDIFFLEAPPGGAETEGDGGGQPLGWRQRERGRGSDASGARRAAPQYPRSHARRHGRARSSGWTSSVALPLLIRTPEVFPALCQQVATAPQGAAPRGSVIETLVAAVHDPRNSKAILSVDCWQQYLLSVVSSAQGRQTVAAAAAFAASGPAAVPSASSGKNPRGTGWKSPAAAGVEDGDTGWHERRGARDEAAEEERLVDQTVRLICWLAMCEAREGRPGRPGAGFAALQDTMSFLRCQAELGTMECVSVGERMLRHMVRTIR